MHVCTHTPHASIKMCFNRRTTKVHRCVLTCLFKQPLNDKPRLKIQFFCSQVQRTFQYHRQVSSSYNNRVNVRTRWDLAKSRKLQSRQRKTTLTNPITFRIIFLLWLGILSGELFLQHDVSYHFILAYFLLSFLLHQKQFENIPLICVHREEHSIWRNTGTSKTVIGWLNKGKLFSDFPKIMEFIKKVIWESEEM